jgi:hypothetical protein
MCCRGELITDLALKLRKKSESWMLVTLSEKKNNMAVLHTAILYIRGK